MCWSVYWDQTEELWSKLCNLGLGNSNKDVTVEMSQNLGCPSFLSFFSIGVSGQLVP